MSWTSVGHGLFIVFFHRARTVWVFSCPFTKFVFPYQTTHVPPAVKAKALEPQRGLKLRKLHENRKPGGWQIWSFDSANER